MHFHYGCLGTVCILHQFYCITRAHTAFLSETQRTSSLETTTSLSISLKTWMLPQFSVTLEGRTSAHKPFTVRRRAILRHTQTTVPPAVQGAYLLTRSAMGSLQRKEHNSVCHEKCDTLAALVVSAIGQPKDRKGVLLI